MNPSPNSAPIRTIAALVAVAVFLGVGTCSADRFDPAHELGLSVGTPSGLNAEYSREFGRAALYLSGAYWGSISGVQGGVSILRTGAPRKYCSLNLIGGYSAYGDSDSGDLETWAYAGVEVFLKWRRFFLAPGLTAGSGSFSNPQLSARLGLTWKL